MTINQIIIFFIQCNFRYSENLMFDVHSTYVKVGEDLLFHNDPFKLIDHFNLKLNFIQ